MAKILVKGGKAARALLQDIGQISLKGGEAAVNTLLFIPKLAVGTVSAAGRGSWGVIKWLGRNPVGAFIVSGLALLGIGTALKSGHDRREQRQQQRMMAVAPEIGALQESIAQSHARRMAVIQALGDSNGRVNPDDRFFRNSVRSGDQAVGGGQDYLV